MFVTKHDQTLFLRFCQHLYLYWTVDIRFNCELFIVRYNKTDIYNKGADSVNTKGADDANGSAKKVPARYRKSAGTKKKKTNIDVIAHTCREIQC